MGENRPYVITDPHTNALIAFPAPLRLCLIDEADGDPLYQAEKHPAFDYVRLNRLSGTLPTEEVGDPQVHLGFDGSLVLFQSLESTDLDSSLRILNKALAHLLVGGIYSESLDSTSVTRATIYKNGYVRISGDVDQEPGVLLSRLRQGEATATDYAALSHLKGFLVGELVRAARVGRRIFSQLAPVSEEFLLRAITYFNRRQWSESLSSAWTVIEQAIAALWGRHMLQTMPPNGEIPGRKDMLKDYRTWSAAVRLETLHRIGVLDFDTLRQASVARKARNDLLHRGDYPIQDHADCALRSMFSLTSLLTSSESDRATLKTSFDNSVGRFIGPPLEIPQPRTIFFDDGDAPKGGWIRMRSLPGEPGWEEDLSNFPYNIDLLQFFVDSTPEAELANPTSATFQAHPPDDLPVA